MDVYKITFYLDTADVETKEIHGERVKKVTGGDNRGMSHKVSTIWLRATVGFKSCVLKCPRGLWW